MQDLESPGKDGNMPSIDLTLAVNYLPAVEVVIKTAFVTSCLALLSPSDTLGGIAVMVMMVSVDRSLSSAWIMDGNALQFSVLLSWFVNYLRTAAVAPGLALPVATWLWCASSFVLVAEPKSVQEFFVLYGSGAGGRFKQVLPAVGNCFFMGLFAFLPGPTESGLAKIARSLGFVALCVLWVYVVNVWRPRPRQQAAGMCVFTSHAIVARFSPVLYVYGAMAVVYSLACAVAVVWHYVRLHSVSVTVHQVQPGSTAPSPPLPEEPHAGMGTITEEDEEDLEAFFQTAKLQQMKACD